MAQVDKPTIVLMGADESSKRKFLTSISIAEGKVYQFNNNTSGTSVKYEGRDFYFALLPGGKPYIMNEADAIKENAQWLSRASEWQMQIICLLYFHPLTSDGLSYETYRYCNVFQRLVGMAAFSGVILVTSTGSFVDAVTARRRQKVMGETVWVDMLANGAQMAQFDGSRESALGLLRIAARRTETLTLSIQVQMNAKGLPLGFTDVGMNKGEDTGTMDETRYRKLLTALLFELMTVSERPSVEEAAPVLSRITGLRRILQEMQDRRRSLGRQRDQDKPTLRNDPPLYDELQPGQIRLVVLQAGDENDPVEIRLVVRNLEEMPVYEALSYVVGRPDLTGTIRIRSGFKVERRPISQSLQCVLKVVRQPESDRMFWVDTLSIDQANLEERGEQVRMMSQIFRRAKNVCIWLGPASNPVPPGGLSSDRAMKFVKEILDLSRLDTYVAEEARRDDWTAFAALLGRDWFRRRWVVQEMALANDATVHCGTAKVSWSDFVDAVALYGSKWPEIIRIRGQNETFKLGEVQAPGAASLVAISGNIFRKDRDGAIQERLLTVETLLSILPMFDVTNLLDAYYAIMDLGNDTFGVDDIPVDYNLHPAELFKAVTQLVINNSKSLDIICRPWAPICDLPSWIRTVSDYAYVRRRDEDFDPRYPDGLYDRRRANSLVGLPGKQYYSAAGDTIPQDIGFVGSELLVSGIELGKVEKAGAQCLNGNIPADWMRLGRWSGSVDDIPGNFWRTLIADRAPDGGNPPSWYARAFKHTFSSSYPDAVNTSRLIERYNKSTNLQEFLHRVQAITWGRIFFTAQIPAFGDRDMEHVGLGPGGPSETRRGDLICVLFGCSVPVVLRRLGGLDSDRVELIGECFVYGMMEGQAIKGLQAGKYVKRKFHIV